VVAGALLASATYGPTTQTTYDLTGTLAALDTTNLTIAFTAPASGKVRVTASMYAVVAPTLTVGDVNSIAVGLFVHGTTTQVGSVGQLTGLQSVSSTQSQRVISTAQYMTIITGLTTGSSYQYDVAAQYLGATPSVAQVIVDSGTGSNNAGPALLAVYSA
jgi:hypothetical protein